MFLAAIVPFYYDHLNNWLTNFTKMTAIRILYSRFSFEIKWIWITLNSACASNKHLSILLKTILSIGWIKKNNKYVGYIIEIRCILIIIKLKSYISISCPMTARDGFEGAKAFILFKIKCLHNAVRFTLLSFSPIRWIYRIFECEKKYSGYCIAKLWPKY